METNKQTLTKAEAINIYGKAIIETAMRSQAEPTSRVIYPSYEPEHTGREEWAGEPIEMEEGTYVRAYYYLTPEEEDNLDYYDWDENVEIHIEM